MAVLKKGAKGSEVKDLQQQLNSALKPSPKLKVDGVFGKQTEQAVREFQKKGKVGVDGKVGDETRGALDKAAKGKKGGTAGGKEDGYTITVKGKKEEILKKDYEAGKQKIIKDVRKGLLVAIRNRASECRILYDHFKQLNGDQWIVSSLIELTSGARLPSESVIKAAESAAKKVEAALGSGNLPKLKKELEAAEKPLNEAVNKMREYRGDVINSGENWVTGLEITKTTSFTIVSTWATAGAGSVASAAYAGGAVALLEASSTQVGKTLANPSKAPSLADLGGIVVDTGVGALGAGFAKGEFGKKILSGASGHISKKLGGKLGSLSSKTITKWFGNAAQHAGSAAIEESIVQVVKQAKPGTKWEDVYKSVAVKAVSSAFFGPFEDMLKSKNVSSQLANAIKNKKKDFLKGALKGKHIELTDKQASELIAKFLSSSSGGATFDKLALEPAFDKATGKETPKQMVTLATEKFITNSKAMNDLAKFIEKNAKKK